MSEPVVWIKVKHQTFDLAGLILSSLTLAAVFALASAVVGALLALTLIRRRRAAASALTVIELGGASPHQPDPVAPPD